LTYKSTKFHVDIQILYFLYCAYKLNNNSYKNEKIVFTLKEEPRGRESAFSEEQKLPETKMRNIITSLHVFIYKNIRLTGFRVI